MKRGNKTPNYMIPVQPGSLLQIVAPEYMPPAEAPKPYLTESDVVEPPLPPVSKTNSNSTPCGTVAAAPAPNGQPKVAASIFVPLMAVLLAMYLLF